MAQGQVLLVEDEPHIAEAIRFILGRAGWAVEVEPDGARALARVRALALQIGVHQRFGEVEALLAAILAHDGDARGLAGVGSGMR